ncbi:Protein tyrosine phosphatase receptor type C-associated protein [Galemys pyrenaicus]|uniref:Protein tyrosine phosphatase receptor type C-associated protein n=1 Tax=Galemys pyrenaicus TaxID=202257 RepID=A0A8J6AKV8_GALPY|nr:Protein tyrosine phosphatase receptor type C-associated protein [Galemys pyrenaicus]
MRPRPGPSPSPSAHLQTPSFPGHPSGQCWPGQPRSQSRGRCRERSKHPPYRSSSRGRRDPRAPETHWMRGRTGKRTPAPGRAGGRVRSGPPHGEPRGPWAGARQEGASRRGLQAGPCGVHECPPLPVTPVSPQALPCALGLGILLALPGALGSGDGTQDRKSASSVTVVLLLLFFLLLVTGLVLAWRRLSRDSGGYYHPARLGAALWGRTRRLFWASPPGRWLQARAELGPADQDPECQDDPDLDEDYNMEGGREEAEGREEERPCGDGPGLQLEASESAEESLGLGAQGAVGPRGSAEALLSDLHAFAGSAAWDDSAGPAGGQGLHVTAL